MFTKYLDINHRLNVLPKYRHKGVTPMDENYWIAYVIEDIIKSIAKLELVESSVVAQELLLVTINEISSKLNDGPNLLIDANIQDDTIVNFAREKLRLTG